MTAPRIGIVDSGLGPRHEGSVVVAARFVPDDYGGLHQGPVTPDLLGHGSDVADIILHHAPASRLYNAQVFDARGVTTAATVAAALTWLREQEVALVNLSLGLQQDREILRAATAAAVAAGLILVAASPAQGGAVFPAAYPGVIRATGDARCDEMEISFLDNRQADFGGCPCEIDHSRAQPPRRGGASLGAAHVTGHIAAYLQADGDGGQLWPWLVSRAKYLHRERRTK